MSRLTGIVPVKGALVPVLVTFADPANPATARAVAPDDAEAVLGKGYRLQGITAEVVPNGYWPIDFGGVLGEPVTRGIQCEIAVAERRRSSGRHRASRGRFARVSTASTPGRLSRESSGGARHFRAGPSARAKACSAPRRASGLIRGELK